MVRSRQLGRRPTTTLLLGVLSPNLFEGGPSFSCRKVEVFLKGRRKSWKISLSLRYGTDDPRETFLEEEGGREEGRGDLTFFRAACSAERSLPPLGLSPDGPSPTTRKQGNKGKKENNQCRRMQTAARLLRTSFQLPHDFCSNYKEPFLSF